MLQINSICTQAVALASVDVMTVAAAAAVAVAVTAAATTAIRECSSCGARPHCCRYHCCCCCCCRCHHRWHLHSRWLQTILRDFSPFGSALAFGLACISSSSLSLPRNASSAAASDAARAFVGLKNCVKQLGFLKRNRPVRLRLRLL